MAFLNPPFDSRILKVGDGSVSRSLTRGSLIADTVTTGRKGSIQFLYNPMSITATHSVDQAATNSADQVTQIAGTTLGNLSQIGSVGFDLLFDRTFEVWSGGGLAGTYGVYADVLAFYAVLGITATGATVSTKPGTGIDVTVPDGGTLSTSGWQNLYPTNGIDPGNLCFLNVGNKINFYGRITDFSVTYTHWSKTLVPMRCQVSLSMAFQPNPTTAGKKISRGKGHIKVSPGTAPGTVPGGITKTIPGGKKP